MSDSIDSKNANTTNNETSPADREIFLARLNQMSRLEFASFLRDAIISETKKDVIEPILSNLRTERVEKNIAETVARYPDYWEYKNLMVKIYEANPNLTSEQVYLLARHQNSDPNILGILKNRGLFSSGNHKKIIFNDCDEALLTSGSIVTYSSYLLVTEINSDKEIMINSSRVKSIEEV